VIAGKERFGLDPVRQCEFTVNASSKLRVQEHIGAGVVVVVMTTAGQS
jgi:hypothetical protein